MTKNADEIEEISSDSSTIVEEPIKRNRTGQPKPVMSDSDEPQTPQKPTKKRAKLPQPPKDDEIVDMISDESDDGYEPIEKPDEDLDESVYSTPVEKMAEKMDDSLENIFQTQREEPKTLDLLRTQKSRGSTQKSRMSTEGTMRSVKTLYNDEPEDVEETDDNCKFLCPFFIKIFDFFCFKKLKFFPKSRFKKKSTVNRISEPTQVFWPSIQDFSKNSSEFKCALIFFLI